jgi:hypothetical protein
MSKPKTNPDKIVKAGLDAIERALLRHGSHERAEAFLELIDDDGIADRPEIFWRALHAEWSGFDKIPHREFERAFKLAKDKWRKSYLPKPDLAFYDSLPDEIEVYRGADAHAEYAVGLSWTLDRTVAESFARGHRGIFNPNPVVLVADVSKRDVAGAYSERCESEIVLFTHAAADILAILDLDEACRDQKAESGLTDG